MGEADSTGGPAADTTSRSRRSLSQVVPVGTACHTTLAFFPPERLDVSQ